MLYHQQWLGIQSNALGKCLCYFCYVSSLDIFSCFSSVCCKSSCCSFPLLNSLDSVSCWFFRSFMKLLVMKDLVCSTGHVWIWWKFCVEIWRNSISHWKLKIMSGKPPFLSFPLASHNIKCSYLLHDVLAAFCCVHSLHHSRVQPWLHISEGN